MFEKKQPIVIDYESLLGPDFLNFISRIDDLEAINAKIERSEQMTSLQWDAGVSEAKRTISHFKADLHRIKETIMELKAEFMNIVTEFKSSGDSEEFDKLKQRIENLDMELLMTREKFENMIKDKKKSLSFSEQS